MTSLLKLALVALGFISTLVVAEHRRDERKMDLETQNHNLLIVVDTSGSMLDSLPTIKTAVKSEISKMQGTDRAGMIDFSGCGEQTTHYEVPLAPGTGPAINSRIDALQSDGATDLLSALTKTREVMEANHVCIRLVLFTDYQDTCNQTSPLTILQGIEKYCLEVNVITYTTDTTSLRFFNKLAEATGGRVFVAESATDKAEALRKIMSLNHGKSQGNSYDSSSSQSSQTSKLPLKKRAPIVQPMPLPLPATYGNGNGNN